MPLTEATDAVGKISAGRLRITVENAAYEKVATAKHAMIGANAVEPDGRHGQHQAECADH